MSTTLGKWRWPAMTAVGVGLLFLFAPLLWGEALGMPSDATWFQFFMVAIGGAALWVLYRAMTDGRAVKQALVGFAGEPGLIAEVRALKEWMASQNGHRKDLSASMRREAETNKDQDRRLDRIEDHLRREGVQTGRPFDAMQFHRARERDAG